MTRIKKHYTSWGSPNNKRVKAHVGDIVEIRYVGSKRLEQHNIKPGMKGGVIAITSSKKNGYSDWFYKIGFFKNGTTDWLMSGSHWEVVQKDGDI